MRTNTILIVVSLVLGTASITYGGFFGTLHKVTSSSRNVVQTSSDITNTVSGGSFSSTSKVTEKKSGYLLKKYRDELSNSYKELKSIQRAFVENELAAKKKYNGKKISIFVYFGSVGEKNIILSSGPNYMQRVSLCVPTRCYRNAEKLQFGDVLRLSGKINQIDPVMPIELDNPSLELLS